MLSKTLIVQTSIPVFVCLLCKITLIQREGQTRRIPQFDGMLFCKVMCKLWKRRIPNGTYGAVGGRLLN